VATPVELAGGSSLEAMPKLSAMFVHAHPDDESSKGAGTMARYAKEGYGVSVVTLTDGAQGDVLNPAMDRPGVKERMVEIRAEELARALEILGVTRSVSLGYADSGWVENFAGDTTCLSPDCFYNVPIDEVVGRLVAIIRAERPDVLVTYPPDGGYPHPDHIRCHEVSVAAYEAAPDPQRYRDAGEPWQVRKLYYSVYSPRRTRLLHEAAVARGIESPYAEWIDHLPDTDPVTTSVHVGDFLAQRSQALLAHATQIDPDSLWFAIPEEIVREVYPCEDYQLARSTVETSLPEDSLFAGLE
jgi:mycothiol S-conjugate amidase